MVSNLPVEGFIKTAHFYYFPVLLQFLIEDQIETIVCELHELLVLGYLNYTIMFPINHELDSARSTMRRLAYLGKPLT